jgi:diguanylate cyclase (GGDEF)-like protein
MVFLLVTIAIVAVGYCWKVYSEKRTLLEEYHIFRLSTKTIHMLQKERGLTVKNLLLPTSENFEELQSWRNITHSAILNLFNIKMFKDILEKHGKLHKAIDSKKISPGDSFLEYSDIIYEIITTFSSDQTFEHVQHDHLFLSLTNLVMAREHLGKIRAYISMLSKSHDVNAMIPFYVKEKFGFYGVSKAEFLKSIKNKYPSYSSIIIEDEKIKNTEEAVLLFLRDDGKMFDYDNWFELSTGAMDVYYGTESGLEDVYGIYLENEKNEAKTNGLLVLCATVSSIALSGFFVGRFMKSFSSRVENIDAQMKFILKTNDYKSEITDRGHDEISGISNSLNSLLRFTNCLLEEKERRASTDRLTGAYNRFKFIEIFEAEFQRFSRYKSTFCLIMMDIDHFKKINDNYGHNVGDCVLAEITAMTSKIIRSTDILVRWGGEEFVVFVPSSELHSAVALAEKLRLAISEHPFSSDLKVTMSFGVAEIEKGDSLETIMARADAALYESKRTGRNKVCTLSTKG